MYTHRAGSKSPASQKQKNLVPLISQIELNNRIPQIPFLDINSGTSARHVFVVDSNTNYLSQASLIETLAA